MTVVLSTLSGLALICALVAVLLAVTGGARLSPTHTPDRRTRRPGRAETAFEHESTQEDLS